MAKRFELAVKRRVKEEAWYIIKNQATIRETASAFGMSKTTVHDDLAKKLPEICPRLNSAVREILETNLKERYFRAGETTKRMYNLK